MTAPVTLEWIAVDRGHGGLRAWAMRGSTVLAEASGAADIGALPATLPPGGDEPALLTLIAPWLTGAPAEIRACGMVGSHAGRGGVPWRTVPCRPVDPGGGVAVPAHDPRLRITVVPGLKQTAPPDLMHGDETRIAGALCLAPGFDGAICLPGNLSRWALVSAGEVVAFQTAMTGEVIALLSRQSMLRDSMQGDGWDDGAFDEALSDAMSHPARFAMRLFGLHAGAVLADLSPAAARARLSGLLIGLDLAASRAYWLGQPVAVLGDDRLAGLYLRALSAQGGEARRIDAGAATCAGLALSRNGPR